MVVAGAIFNFLLALDLFSSHQVTGKFIEANAAYTIPLLGGGNEDVDRLVEASVKAACDVYELVVGRCADLA